MPLVALVLTSMTALAAEAIKLTIKGQQFVPTDVSVPAGERFRIEVENQDAAPAEFESADLRVEKIVVPGGKITVMAGPLKPGTYKFFDDYHPDTRGGAPRRISRMATQDRRGSWRIIAKDEVVNERVGGVAFDQGSEYPRADLVHHLKHGAQRLILGDQLWKRKRRARYFDARP
jgi:Cupredoxin-like domain